MRRHVQQLARLLVLEVADLLVALLDIGDGARELGLDGHLEELLIGVGDGGWPLLAQLLQLLGLHQRHVQPVLHPFAAGGRGQLLALHHVECAAEYGAQHARLHAGLDLSLAAEVRQRHRTLQLLPVE